MEEKKLDQIDNSAQRYELPKRIQQLEARLDRLESLLIESFHFLGEELRPIFGKQGEAMLYDAVERRFRKELEPKNGKK